MNWCAFEWSLNYHFLPLLVIAFFFMFKQSLPSNIVSLFLYFLLNSFIVLSFTFWSMIYLRFMFMCGGGGVRIYLFFPCGFSIVSVPFIENFFLFLLYCSLLSLKIKWWLFRLFLKSVFCSNGLIVYHINHTD